MEKYHILRKCANAIVLLAFIGSFIVFNIMTPDRVFSEEENRVLEQMPGFSLDKVLKGRFASDFEKYIADQFAFRDFFVNVKSQSGLALGMKENNEVYVGREGYLFEDFKKPSDMNFKERIEMINSFAELAPKINTYFMLVPNSVEVLEDKLPPYAPVDDENQYLNKIKESINKNIKFVDIYDTLLSKRNEYIYYKTDHHWTTRAAFYAYERLSRDMGFTSNGEDYFNITKVTDRFYGTLYSKGGFRNINPDTIELYIPKEGEVSKVIYIDNGGVSNSLYNMKNLEKKDKYTVFLDGNHPLVKISSKSLSGRKLLMLKDSYSNCFTPFLEAHFSEIYMVDPRYYDGDLACLINDNKIKDVLILYNVKTFFEDSSFDNVFDSIKELPFTVRLDPEPETSSVMVASFGSPSRQDDVMSENYKGSGSDTYAANNSQVVGDKPSGNYNEIFKDSIFMGDSISIGLSAYGFLSDSRVDAKVGASTIYARSRVNTIAQYNPKKVFLLYGINELSVATSSQSFVDRYRQVVKDLKNKLPDSKIYIQSVLPIAPFVEDNRSDLRNSHLKECNEGLIKMAKEENISYIDIASLLNESNRNLYAGDGIHFQPKFYIMWLNYLDNVINASSSSVGQL